MKEPVQPVRVYFKDAATGRSLQKMLTEIGCKPEPVQVTALIVRDANGERQAMRFREPPDEPDFSTLPF